MKPKFTIPDNRCTTQTTPPEIRDFTRNGISVREYIFPVWESKSGEHNYKGKLIWEREVDGDKVWPLVHADFDSSAAFNLDQYKSNGLVMGPVERARTLVEEEFDQVDWESWK